MEGEGHREVPKMHAERERPSCDLCCSQFAILIAFFSWPGLRGSSALYSLLADKSRRAGISV